MQTSRLDQLSWLSRSVVPKLLMGQPPAEYEMVYCRQLAESTMVAWLKQLSLWNTRGDSEVDWPLSLAAVVHRTWIVAAKLSPNGTGCVKTISKKQKWWIHSWFSAELARKWEITGQ